MQKSASFPLKVAWRSQTVVIVFCAPTHHADLLFAQRCLKGDTSSLRDLQSTYARGIVTYLLSVGATSEEASGVVESLWGDLMGAANSEFPRFARYDGKSALQTWLNTVAFNGLLTFKRVEKRRARRFLGSEDLADIEDFVFAPDDIEAPLLLLIREAIEFAFAACPAEGFVMLHLEHIDRLDRDELSLLFGRSASTISRTLDAAREDVSQAALVFIRERDPWLELRWEDFVDLCRNATPKCFGLED